MKDKTKLNEISRLGNEVRGHRLNDYDFFTFRPSLVQTTLSLIVLIKRSKRYEYVLQTLYGNISIIIVCKYW